MQRRTLRRPIGEEQADERIDGFVLARRHEMKLKDEVRTGRESPRFAVDAWEGRHSGRPAEQVAVRRLRVTHIHSVKARIGIPKVAPTRGSRFIDCDEGVMNHSRIPRAKLHGPHESCGSRRDRNHEVAPQIGAACRQREGLRQLDHEVGLAQAPSVGHRGLSGMASSGPSAAPVASQRRIVSISTSVRRR